MNSVCQRDAVLLAMLYNTGARVSGLTALRVEDVLADRGSALHLHGKGRKERIVPLWKMTAAHLRVWLPHIDPSPASPVFLNRVGERMSRSGVEHRLGVALETASKRCPSFRGRRISPSTMRHQMSVIRFRGHQIWLPRRTPAALPASAGQPDCARPDGTATSAQLPRHPRVAVAVLHLVLDPSDQLSELLVRRPTRGLATT